jgi:hypothetical protein
VLFRVQRRTFLSTHFFFRRCNTQVAPQSIGSIVHTHIFIFFRYLHIQYVGRSKCSAPTLPGPSERCCFKPVFFVPPIIVNFEPAVPLPPPQRIRNRFILSFHVSQIIRVHASPSHDSVYINTSRILKLQSQCSVMERLMQRLDICRRTQRRKRF